MTAEREIARRAGVIASFTLASRVLGMVRDMVTAALFPRWATDAFFAAFTIPNAFRQLLGEGSLVAAFIPVFTEKRRESEEEARNFAARTLGAALLVVSIVCVLGILFAPTIVLAFAAGFRAEPGKFEAAVLLTQVMFPYLAFVVIASLQMGVLNTLGHFAAPAASPVVLNLAIISGALTLSGSCAALGLPATASLAVGVVAGGVLQLFVAVGPLRRRGYLLRPRLDLRDPGVRRLAGLMAPALLGLVIYQVNIALSRLLASYLGEGPVSSLYYAQRLIELPLGLFAFSMATATLPSLASNAAEGDHDRFRDTYRDSLRLTLYEVIPASLSLAVLGVPLCAVLFQRGHFDFRATQETARVLAAFSLGLWAAAGVRQTAPAFYALGDTKTPVRMAALGLCTFVTVALVLRGPMGAPGLALAVATSSIVQFLGLALWLRRRLGFLGGRVLVSSIARSLLASVGAVAVAWLVCRGGNWEAGGTLPSNYLVLAGAVMSAVLVYLSIGAVVRSPELLRLRDAFRRRR